jgi:hypothetical protein
MCQVPLTRAVIGQPEVERQPNQSILLEGLWWAFYKRMSWFLGLE